MNYNGQSNRGGNFRKVPGAPYVLRVGDPSPTPPPSYPTNPAYEEEYTKPEKKSRRQKKNKKWEY
ncbi:MAG: hypothetical protein GX095_05465 [Clostridiales bacterium]|jgi:hypothetical protein|nr:hypothetical protein [Clostridiales bacterium]HOB63943.1 hypothetical protein [Clostridia bacterium]HOK82194.1 hypothetical protein [Clostridia bacterium]HOL61343.1 hypothetical protein [Clostridia bacterium]HPO54008.1 hypothetical protein [Clostridia bacterium]